MKRIAIIGSRELCNKMEPFLQRNGYEIAGFFDDNISASPTKEFSFLGNFADIKNTYLQHQFDEVFLGIPYEQLPQRGILFDSLVHDKIPIVSIIDSSSKIDSSANIGYGNIIYPDCIVDKNAKIVRNNILEEAVAIGEMSIISYSLIGRYTYTGECCHITSAKIGRYCAISWNVTIGPGTHDYTKLTSHSLLAMKKYGFVETPLYNLFDKNCTIGHDVWIGCNSVIMRGVSVGNGAVVGANSVVTKSIPPYAIVAGCPAKIIKYRFTDDIIERLLDLNWWNLEIDTLKKNISLLTGDITIETLDKFKSAINTQKKNENN